MTYAMMTEQIGGVNECLVIREKKNRIAICTQNTLTDDQMRDLYWISLAMSRTGMTLKDIIRKEEKDGRTVHGDAEETPGIIFKRHRRCGD